MPLFPPLEGRTAGVLLHPTSLPGPGGVGTLGQKAYRFVDFLAAAGARYWQMLPVGPVADDGSPYRSFSSCAGNPYLIDLDALVAQDLLSAAEVEPLNHIGSTKVDYAGQHRLRFAILARAYEACEGGLTNKGAEAFDAFCAREESWLGDYALFAALKEKNEERMWKAWPAEERVPTPARKRRLAKELATPIRRHKWWQYLFRTQWAALRGYAAQRGVQLIGDVPIYVPEDSVDVWANQKMFLLEESGEARFVGGCPPDYFDANGQRWGNPIYHWPEHKRTKYAWWMERFEETFRLFDVVRVDHFRGFYDYWKIPAETEGAKHGTWELGPGLEFFEILKEKIPHARLIAEDLGGDLHQGVKDLLRDTGLPGLAVLQFAFGGDAQNPYLPHNMKVNQVAYTGTHDNNTLAGWVEQGFAHEISHACKYLGCHPGQLVERGVKAVLQSVAALAVVPVQDLLGLGAWARMNVPGTPLGNWQWRLSEEELARLNAHQLHEELRMCGRA